MSSVPQTARRDLPPAVIYCRVSDPKQKKEGDGLRSQETRCRQYADACGYRVVKVFRDDFTGGVSSRPEINEMRDFLNRETDPYFVIIDDITRWARDVEAHWQLRRAVKNSGGILVSPSMEFRDSATGRFFENIMASGSQFQREHNAEQVKNRMMARSTNGYWCFWPPVGYRFEKVEGHGKLMRRNEPVASLVQEALEGFASGRFQTPTEVARFLASRPEWAKSSRPKLNHRHTRDILVNPLYAAHIDLPAWGLRMIPAKHEPLISLETRERILRRLEQGANAPARKNIGQDFALRGFVCCASCGKPYQSCWSKGRSKTYPYYLCATTGCPDYRKSIPRDAMEAEFTEIVRSLRPSYSLFAYARDSFRRQWDRRAQRAKEDAASIKTELAEIERGVAQLVQRIMDSDVTPVTAVYEKKIGDLEARKALLRERAVNSHKPTHDFMAGFRTALAFFANPQKLWLSGRFDLRRIVLKLAFADRIVYARNEGFRTAVTSLPFTLLSCSGSGGGGLVGPAGLEPARPCGQQILSLQRLPFRHGPDLSS